MAVNFYLTTAIGKKMNEACNAIYNIWYINCIQTAIAYKVLFYQL